MRYTLLLSRETATVIEAVEEGVRVEVMTLGFDDALDLGQLLVLWATFAPVCGVCETD
jgi:hypothetical protein